MISRRLTMETKGSVGSVIIFLFVAALAVATEGVNGFERSKGVNGLDTIILRDASNRSVEVYLYGAQVMSWKNEKGEELLVVSSKAIFEPPKPIRGGIPLCFPQYANFGSLDSHGFARNRFWEIETNPPPLKLNFTSTTFVDLILRSSPEDLKIWPHNFVYRLRVALGPQGELSVTSRVTNTNSNGNPFAFTFAYHPYFAISDISEVKVEGLEKLDWLDQQKNRTRFPGEDNAITFKAQLDRIYQRSAPSMKILDLKNKKTILVQKEGLPDAVVWNPWEKKVSDLAVEDYRRFVTVEGAAIEKPVALKPGQEWQGTLLMSVLPAF